MRLFIRLNNGSPEGHPIFEDNFKQAFPEIDVDNLPEGFAEFKRVDVPTIGVYQVYNGVTYEQDGDIFKDVHHVRDMTDSEIASKQQAVQDDWEVNGFPSWVFDSDECCFKPPLEYPSDGESYSWNEATTSWVAGVLPKEYNTGGS